MYPRSDRDAAEPHSRRFQRTVKPVATTVREVHVTVAGLAIG
jgi:hypothetical protein